VERLDGRVVLGHTRLSIIDLSGSRQPMTNEDGTVIVTYNGEIYNFAELRQSLLDRRHTFRTKGDTEVLPHRTRNYGAEMVRRLDGMFAFGLYDRARRRLILARDRIGIKPLYYFHDATTGGLLFASDMRALAQQSRAAAASRPTGSGAVSTLRPRRAPTGLAPGGPSSRAWRAH